MNKEKFFIADPYNEDHIKLFADFERKNNLPPTTSEDLIRIRDEYSKEEYAKLSKESNDINQCLFIINDSGIKDSCYINGVKDIKTSTLLLATIKTTEKNRKILSIATDYVFNTLDMENVFIKVPDNDKDMITNLERIGYETLGPEGIYFKDKPEEKTTQDGMRI